MRGALLTTFYVFFYVWLNYERQNLLRPVDSSKLFFFAAFAYVLHKILSLYDLPLDSTIEFASNSMRVLTMQAPADYTNCFKHIDLHKLAGAEMHILIAAIFLSLMRYVQETRNRNTVRQRGSKGAAHRKQMTGGRFLVDNPNLLDTRKIQPSERPSKLGQRMKGVNGRWWVAVDTGAFQSQRISYGLLGSLMWKIEPPSMWEQCALQLEQQRIILVARSKVTGSLKVNNVKCPVCSWTTSFPLPFADGNEKTFSIRPKWQPLLRMENGEPICYTECPFCFHVTSSITKSVQALSPGRVPLEEHATTLGSQSPSRRNSAPVALGQSVAWAAASRSPKRIGPPPSSGTPPGSPPRENMGQWLADRENAIREQESQPRSSSQRRSLSEEKQESRHPSRTQSPNQRSGPEVEGGADEDASDKRKRDSNSSAEASNKTNKRTRRSPRGQQVQDTRASRSQRHGRRDDSKAPKNKSAALSPESWRAVYGPQRHWLAAAEARVDKSPRAESEKKESAQKSKSISRMNRRPGSPGSPSRHPGRAAQKDQRRIPKRGDGKVQDKIRQFENLSYEKSPPREMSRVPPRPQAAKLSKKDREAFIAHVFRDERPPAPRRPYVRQRDGY